MSSSFQTHPIPTPPGAPFLDSSDATRAATAQARFYEADAYLDRITEQYGAGHSETAFAQQLVDDARAVMAEVTR